MDNILKNYREKNKLSLSELARKAGLSRQLLFWHEKHPKSKWEYKNAIKIDQATNAGIRWIELVD